MSNKTYLRELRKKGVVDVIRRQVSRSTQGHSNQPGPLKALTWELETLTNKDSQTLFFCLGLYDLSPFVSGLILGTAVLYTQFFMCVTIIQPWT